MFGGKRAIVLNALEPIHWLLGNGQSNSVGGGGGVAEDGDAAPTVINSSPLSPDCLMLSTGIATPRGQGVVMDYGPATALIPAYEVQYNAGQAETQLTRMLYEIRKQREARGEIQTLLGALSIGSGGLTITELMTGNTVTSALAGLRKIGELCRQRGLRPEFTFVWHQGESQYGVAAETYYAELISYMTFANATYLPIIRQFNPSHPPLQMLIGQLPVRLSGSRTPVAYGQLLAAQRDPNIWMGSATHMLARVDQYHYGEVSLQLEAAQLATSFVDLKKYGRTRDLQMVSCTTTDNINFTVQFGDNSKTLAAGITHGPLRIDDAFPDPAYVYPSATACGFEFTDPAAVISGVTVASDSTLTIATSVSPGVGSVLYYTANRLGHDLPYMTGLVTDSRAGTPTYATEQGLSWTNRSRAYSTQVPVSITAGSDPSVLLGLQEWFRADTGVTKDGSNRISAVTAKQGTSTLANATAAKQPLYVASACNGHPGWQFVTARGDRLPWTGTFPTGDHAVIAILCSWTANAFSQHIFSTASTSHQLFMSDANAVSGRVVDTVDTLQRSVARVGSPNIQMPMRSFAQTTDRKLYVSAEGAAFVATSNAATGTWTPSNTATIGSQGASTAGALNCTMLDLFIFNRTLHTADDAVVLTTIKNYAADRYGWAAT